MTVHKIIFLCGIVFFSYLICLHSVTLLADIAFFFLEMQQERPSLPEDISPELAFIVQSCWVEDPNMRPSFNQIIRMLNEFLFTLPPSSPLLLEPNTVESPEATSNGTVSALSARSRGKFAFLRQLFAAKKTRNPQMSG